MRFKDLLFEASEKAKLKELDSLIQNGNWIVNFDIPIYRATTSQQNLFKVKKTTKRKETRDTTGFVDELIHRFYKQCYSKYPDRRTCRFGSTYRKNIKTYLDPPEKESFVILPSRSAKISNRKKDPFDVLNGVKRCSDKIFKYKIESLDTNLEVTDYVGNHSKYLQKFLSFLLDLREQKDSEIAVSEIGCPQKLSDRVDKELSKIVNDELSKLIKCTKDAITSYFFKLDLGYPENIEDGGEVMWDGKYIQIKENFYEKYVQYKTGK